MTVDADIKKEDASLRKSYLGTDNYLLGFRLGEYLKKAKPNGEMFCLIEGNAAADSILRRASGTRDSLSGKKDLDRLKGEGGWTEVSGCRSSPMTTDLREARKCRTFSPPTRSSMPP
jgi:ribose transport system substrate-binding protein